MMHDGLLSAYCQDMSGGHQVNPPSYQRLALEQLALWEYYSFMVASPYLGFIAAATATPCSSFPASRRPIVRRRLSAPFWHAIVTMLTVGSSAATWARTR